jgi:hypothetical protein
MPVALYPPPRPQSIGEVLDSTFRIFRATLLRCLPYGVLATVAGQLPRIYDIVTRRPLRHFDEGDGLWWLLYAAGAFLGAACFNVILLQQYATALGSPTQTRTAVLQGLRKTFPVAAIFILWGLATALCFLPAAALPQVPRVWATGALSLAAVYVFVLFSCSWPALLVGGRGILASLSYSVRIVRGNWWRTVAIYSVGIAVLPVFYALAGVVALVFVPFGGTEDLAVITAVSTVTVVALGAVAVPFICGMALAVYGDLEARKSGTDLERRIADVVTS